MSAEIKYSPAVELYRTTDLSITEISRRCGVSRKGLAAYIQRNHRDLMFARHGVDADSSGKLRASKGQSLTTREKYRKAIDACDSDDYLSFNISQIAQLFGLDGAALANQLRSHYPDILARREAERRNRGLADNSQRGARRRTSETYADAVEMLRKEDVTVEEAAAHYGVSMTGLRQHMLYYHRDLLDMREQKRAIGKARPNVGRLAGNGRIRKPSAEREAYFSEAVEIFRSTSLPMTEIAKKCGVPVTSLRYYMKMWHRKLIFERCGTDGADRQPLNTVKRYKRATAEKYAAAIELLRIGDCTTEAVARRMGFTPEVLRAYVREHEPQLWESLGMMRLDDGRTVLRRSYEKYSAAIEAYAQGRESLRAIALRMGINYKSLSGYIRRHNNAAH